MYSGTNKNKNTKALASIASRGSSQSSAPVRRESTFADDTSGANATPLDKYEDTKKMLQKTGVKFIPRKRVQFDESPNGKDYINAGSFGAVYKCRKKGHEQRVRRCDNSIVFGVFFSPIIRLKI